MKVLIFGATGMVGQGALRECLLDDRVDQVLVIGRSPTGRTHTKLREIVHADLADLTPLADQLSDVDACLFCLGVSSAGLDPERYRQITYDLTLSAARTVTTASPGVCFEYVSGAGTDSTEQGRVRWARVKGATENALLALHPNSYLLRPGIIQPRHGVRSKTRLYAAVYTVAGPLISAVRVLAPGAVTTSDGLGRAMISVAADGAPGHILSTRDLNRIAAADRAAHPR